MRARSSRDLRPAATSCATSPIRRARCRRRYRRAVALGGPKRRSRLDGSARGRDRSRDRRRSKGDPPQACNLAGRQRGNLVRTTSRRFEFPSLRQRVVVSPEISTLTTAKAELLDPVGVEQRRCRRTISQGYRKRQDILEGGHGAATRARLPDPRAFAHRSHHVPRPINDQLRD